MGVSFKKRAPRCISTIRQLAARVMKEPIENVVIDESVNVYVWKKGIKAPPRRIRVLIEHIKSEDEQNRQPVTVTLAQDNDEAIYERPEQFRKLRMERQDE